ncbi:MAG: GNAT family N-acetyltransferase [Pseudomonadota bacterium]
MITTRLATRADIPKAASVHIESCIDIYRPFLTADQHSVTLPESLKRIWAEERLEGGDFILLAEDDGQTIGLVTVRMREPAYIDHFHVRPALKGAGTGRILMREVVAELRRRGAKACYLDYALGNDAAAAFYGAMGGEEGEDVMGDLFGTPLPARIVRWPDLAALQL